jgi:hypothetical protein
MLLSKRIANTKKEPNMKLGITHPASAQSKRAIASIYAARCSLLAGLVLSAVLSGCAGPPDARPLPFYRCEYGIEFTAKFIDDSVALDSSRGYDVLYRGGKHASSPSGANTNTKPNEYSNARMQAEFNLGPTQSEAIVRYPMLPLVSRCVRDR